MNDREEVTTMKKLHTPMIRFMITRLAALIAVLLLGGCAVGPDFKRPSPDVPQQWMGAQAMPGQEASSALSSWWLTFNDPALSSLIERGIRFNLDLKIAGQRLRQSRAALSGASSGLFPSLDASARYQRSGTHLPDDSDDLSGTSTRSGSQNLYRSGFDSSWEIDLFGGVRRSIEAARADTQASVENERGVLVSLVSEIGIDYMELRGLQEQLRITRENLKIQERSAQITRKRFDAGFASALDVANAEAQTATTRAQIPSQEASVRQTIYRIGLLLGENPAALVDELSPEKPLPTLPGRIPLDLPSELLERRPDIRLAEARFHAATARIGVARADLFPRFFLTGSASLQANALESWSSSITRLWAIGPSVSWNIFQGGLTQSRIEGNRALAEQSLLEYRKSILVALQEVESALLAFDKEAQRQASLQTAVESSRHAVDLAERLYAGGENDFLSVLVSQRSLYASQAELARSRDRNAANLITLYKALGGGWETAPAPEQPPPGR